MPGICTVLYSHFNDRGTSTELSVILEAQGSLTYNLLSASVNTLILPIAVADYMDKVHTMFVKMTLNI